MDMIGKAKHIKVNNCVEDRLFRHDRRDSCLSTVSTISQYPCYCIRSPYGVYEPLLLVGSTIIGLQAKHPWDQVDMDQS